MNPVPIDVKQKGQMWLLPPYSWTHRKIANELGVSPSVVSRWRNELVEEGRLDESENKSNNGELSPEERFFVVLETATMSERELAEYCRHKGLFVDEVKSWKTLSIQAHAPKPDKSEYKENKELRAEKRKVKALEKELARKDKALAETAALLILREKFKALRENSEED